VTIHQTDPLPLAQALLRCPSVTPDDAGAQTILSNALTALGFTVTRLRFGATDNFFARIGTESPHFCFAGHTDVVPAGGAWAHEPFAGVVENGVLYGRGACDMKGAIAAFAAAAAAHLQAGAPRGSISLLITGDEEGPALDGTVRVLEWMAENGQIPDLCLVGEPTNPGFLGEVIKIGRRGSLNASVKVFGTQGHVAYPHRADNPVHPLIAALSELTGTRLDEGTAQFEPSSLQVTSIDVGNTAANVIPAEARAELNIRFNDLHTGASLSDWLRGVVELHCRRAELAVRISGEAFQTSSPDFTARLAAVIGRASGAVPRLETGGGTSDARCTRSMNACRLPNCGDWLRSMPPSCWSSCRDTQAAFAGQDEAQRAGGARPADGGSRQAGRVRAVRRLGRGFSGQPGAVARVFHRARCVDRVGRTPAAWAGLLPDHGVRSAGAGGDRGCVLPPLAPA
jgi:succinyl-diaminopimelate desuccinylase